ncbi:MULTISPECIES: hypothetical protein [Burkholderia cepacia complex]|jgi:hypothetical protein|uniref:hypothetical protein n=1 Tax=Burkholderia cepacia complex TaxID=87882 RepID=UPI0000535520|nr:MULTISPECIES: hypothetical protein [Burkholderia cepacia complex]MCW3705446.1 hypothetical protein [Burkholderia cenocepacia]MBR8016579.1 hypothetical protein [Burkholderia vietnamiensis]MBR8231807.1 hypothetical protein [Burkholderia vietnamiensis]MCA8148980.1 hypothetical protein [Burkholderia vietnamiensis]HDR8951454.1 hypothetical protein [Burkholderia vietnamiensis]
MHRALVNAAVLKYSQMDTLLRTLHAPSQRRRRNPLNRARRHDERRGDIRKSQAQHVPHARQVEAPRVAKIEILRRCAPALQAGKRFGER